MPTQPTEPEGLIFDDRITITGHQHTRFGGTKPARFLVLDDSGAETSRLLAVFLPAGDGIVLLAREAQETKGTRHMVNLWIKGLVMERTTFRIDLRPAAELRAMLTPVEREALRFALV